MTVERFNRSTDADTVRMLERALPDAEKGCPDVRLVQSIRHATIDHIEILGLGQQLKYTPLQEGVQGFLSEETASHVLQHRTEI